ncbi:hypothetical protein ACQ4PT_051851 [Festuca glaucescens]
MDARSSILALRHREEVSTLHYRVLIHVDRVEEDVVSQLWSSSDGGDRRDLPPQGTHGGGGRRRRDFRWQRGVPDRRGGGGGGDSGGAAGRRSYRQALLAPSDWALPAMDSQMERHVMPTCERFPPTQERTGQISNHLTARCATRPAGGIGRSSSLGHFAAEKQSPFPLPMSNQQVWVKKQKSRELLTATETESEKASSVTGAGAGGAPSNAQLSGFASVRTAIALDQEPDGTYEVEDDRDAAIRWEDAPDSLAGGGDPEGSDGAFNMEEYFVVSLSGNNDKDKSGNQTRQSLSSPAGSDTGSSSGPCRGQDSGLQEHNSFSGSLDKETRELARETREQPPSSIQPLSCQSDGCMPSPNQRRVGFSAADPAREHVQGTIQGQILHEQHIVLTAMVAKAVDENLLGGLAGITALQRISIYADDVVLFCKPVDGELMTIRQIMDAFGEASGLRVNHRKTTATMIRGTEEELDITKEIIGCRSENFPIKYLGLQLALRPLTKAEWQPLLDAVVHTLPAWQRGFIARAGRLTLINSVMLARPIHHIIVDDPPKWLLEEVEKHLRGFFWVGKK